MTRIPINTEENTALRSFLDELVQRFDSVEDPGFLSEAAVLAHELPLRLRQKVSEFRLAEPKTALCILSDYAVDQERAGSTPTHWRHRVTPSPTLREELLLVLFGSLLGDPIAWGTQQNGYLVHDISPIQGHEQEQLGSGSEQPLWWHTEDAFHPFRGDYIGMMCLRNPDRVATTFASLENLDLGSEEFRPLFEPRFTIRPDESHLKKNRAGAAPSDAFLEASYRRIEKMNESPEKISVLEGPSDSPYIRLDPYFMDPVGDVEAQQALDRFIKAIDQKLEDLVLLSGDFCFIDNFKAVHGRRPFRARFDGNDRWIKRINITRDLRKSRIARREASSRVIF
jgi:Fe(II)/alpha-ketoglutarate-dependent arginine beta-hydroxylase